jgi:hypothetical protein
MRTKSVDATIEPGDGPGEFDVLLSNGALDRDGERLALQSWVQPLPEQIPLNVDHSSHVSDIVGSGRPFFDTEGNLRVVGTFADTEQAQHVRALVNGGHVRSVSVEFLRRKDGNGEPRHELIGGAFVNVPSNPEARVLASKGATGVPDWFVERLNAVLAGRTRHEGRWWGCCDGRGDPRRECSPRSRLPTDGVCGGP